MGRESGWRPGRGGEEGGLGWGCVGGGLRGTNDCWWVGGVMCERMAEGGGGGGLRGRNDCWWGVNLVMCERVEGADRGK